MADKIYPVYIPAHGNGAVTVKTSPEVSVVSLAEFKEFAKIDSTSEDTTLELFIASATQAVEDFLKKALIERTLILSLDWWPDLGTLQLPYPPLVSVVEVRTLDEDNVKTVYTSTSYFVRTNPILGEIVIKIGVTPPINTTRYNGGYEVEYVAGYGKDPTDVPAAIRHGIMLLATHLYESRIPIAESGYAITNLVPGLKDLLNYHRRIRI
jgi:uncharacterized phiE125 gp8 family phage protein